MTPPNRMVRQAGRIVGVLLAATSLPATAQEVTAANTSRYAGDDRWDWTIFIKAAPEVLKKVRCVEYTLHPTYPAPNQKICKNRDPKHPFGLRSNGWGTFEIPIRVVFQNGRTYSLKHKLQFEAPQVDASLPIETHNTATRVGPDWWDWTVFIEAPPEVLDQVNCVEYTLHSTFAKPLREVCNRGTGPAFALSESGWGTFSIQVRVLLKDGRVRNLTHRLQFK